MLSGDVYIILQTHLSTFFFFLTKFS
jgi:hypothetical protein